MTANISCYRFTAGTARLSPRFSAVGRPNKAFGQILIYGKNLFCNFTVTFFRLLSSNERNHPNVRKKQLIRIGLVSAAVSLGFIAIMGAAPRKAACKGTIEHCCKKKKDSNHNNQVWENLPHQFFSSVFP
jgi:hypothetical protein